MKYLELVKLMRINKLTIYKLKEIRAHTLTLCTNNVNKQFILCFGPFYFKAAFTFVRPNKSSRWTTCIFCFRGFVLSWATSNSRVTAFRKRCDLYFQQRLPQIDLRSAHTTPGIKSEATEPRHRDLRRGGAGWRKGGDGKKRRKGVYVCSGREPEGE